MDSTNKKRFFKRIISRMCHKTEKTDYSAVFFCGRSITERQRKKEMDIAFDIGFLCFPIFFIGKEETGSRFR